jgi:hypothetical protein
MIRTKTKTARNTRAASRSQPTLVGKCLVVDPRVCHGQLSTEPRMSQLVLDRLHNRKSAIR